MDTSKDNCAGLIRRLYVQQPSAFLTPKGWVNKLMAHQEVKSVKISGDVASENRSVAQEYLESLKNSNISEPTPYAVTLRLSLTVTQNHPTSMIMKTGLRALRFLFRLLSSLMVSVMI